MLSCLGYLRENQPQHSMIWRDHKSKASWLHLLVRAVPDTQVRDGPSEGLHFLNSVIPSATLERTTPIPVGTWTMLSSYILGNSVQGRNCMSCPRTAAQSLKSSRSRAWGPYPPKSLPCPPFCGPGHLGSWHPCPNM